MASSEPEAPDEQIRRAKAGDRDAFQQLAEQHSESLRRGAHALCRDWQKAEDIAQEALFEAWRSMSRFDGRHRFSTWLYGILRHRFLKSLRRRSPAGLTDAQSASLPHDGAEPSLAAENSEAAELLRQAISRLPDEHRRVIELRFFADASLDDISAALDIPLGTAKSRLHHGLQKLRGQLG